MSEPYARFQEIVAEVPEILQPLVIAAAGMVPYIEGEGAAAFGVVAGVHPVVAGLAAAAGNIICVVLVVLLGARIREAVLGSRARRVVDAPVPVGATGSATPDAPAGPAEPAEPAEPTSKGRQRLERWLVRFGVPGASLLAPLALPTMLTAATFVASGVSKRWVVLWQVVAIVVWTGAVTVVTTGVLGVVAS